MTELFITSPIPPSVNHYTKSRTVIKNGKPLSVVYKTKEAVLYQEEFKRVVLEAVREQEWNTDLDNPRHFYVDADFYMDKKRKDTNNYWKCLLDAITDTQLIWKDDGIVCERVNKLVYDSDNPRIELHIHYVDYVGVFDNDEQLELFINSNCCNCSRYKRNCSLLRNAVDGRIQPEIVGISCSKCRNSAK